MATDAWTYSADCLVNQSAVDNATQTRSYARNRYYDPASSRTNLRLLTGWRVNEVQFNDAKHATGITMQERQLGSRPANATAHITTVRARREVVLAAGALHSPQILQRSGIGPAPLLRAAGIDVLVDLPGVGSNLQDHPVGHMQYTCRHGREAAERQRMF